MSEAERLADLIDELCLLDTSWAIPRAKLRNAAAELRSLEAECEQLRAALAEIKAFVCGSSVPRWDTTDHTYASREAIANRVDAAIAKETK